MNTDWVPLDIPDSEFVFRVPDWMVQRARELVAEGKTLDQAARIVAKEALTS